MFVFDHKLGKVKVAIYVDDCIWCFENEKVQGHFETLRFTRRTLCGFVCAVHQVPQHVDRIIEHDKSSDTVSLDQSEYVSTVAQKYLS